MPYNVHNYYSTRPPLREVRNLSNEGVGLGCPSGTNESLHDNPIYCTFPTKCFRGANKWGTDLRGPKRRYVPILYRCSILVLPPQTRGGPISFPSQGALYILPIRQSQRNYLEERRRVRFRSTYIHYHLWWEEFPWGSNYKRAGSDRFRV